MAVFEWDFFDRVKVLADEVGPGSAEEFSARFPLVLPRGMQVLTGLDYDLSSDARTAVLTLTMASRRRLEVAASVTLTAEMYQAMAEEVSVAIAYAALQLLDRNEFSETEVSVMHEDAMDADRPMAYVADDRYDLQRASENRSNLSRFEQVGGLAAPWLSRTDLLHALRNRLVTLRDGAAAAELRKQPYTPQDPQMLHPRDFERLLKRLLEAIGLTAKQTPYSKDDGVDVIAEDHRPFHRGRVVVQAKRYAGSVGVTTVRELNGVLPIHRAQRGIVVTTGTFTREAVATARQLGIELIDGVELRQALAEHLSS